MRRNRLHSQQGMATIEFTGIALILMAVVFGIVEFGSLIQAQAVVTNVTREGGNLASRDLKNGEDLLRFLESSTWPLNFSCDPDDSSCQQVDRDKLFKIYIAKANAGDSSDNTPSCTLQGESGTLEGIGVVSPVNDPDSRCDLPQNLWDALTFNTDGEESYSLLSQLTVVKVYYYHDPITPLAGILNVGPAVGGGSIFNFDSTGAIPTPQNPDVYLDSFLLSSKAIF